MESPRIGWTPTGSEPGWVPVETDSWEEFEEAAQQNVQGTTEKAMDYALDVLGLLRTEMETQMDHQAETLRAARGSDEFGRLGQVENLMGPVRYIWDRNVELQRQVEAF